LVYRSANAAKTSRPPTWFLYSLVCYDQWDKLFIQRSLPRPMQAAAAQEVAGLVTQ
jgi:hypothetical protein